MLECPDCGKEYDEKRSLSQHQRWNHDNPWEDPDKLRELYIDGLMSIDEIADKFGKSQCSIRTQMEKHGIDRRTAGETHNAKTHKLIDADDVVKMYFEKYMSTTEIADKYPKRVHMRNIREAIERQGYSLRDEVERILADRSNMKLQKKEWLKSQYEKHKSALPIADELGVSKSAVQNALERHNINASNKREFNGNWKGGHEYNYGSNWERQRDKRRKVDENECVVCGMSNGEHRERHGCNLHVHHIQRKESFRMDNGKLDHERANRIENLITLCYKCHNRWEGIPLRPDFDDNNQATL